MAHWAARRYGLGCMKDRIGIDAVVTLEIGEVSGLPEMLDAEGLGAMAIDAAQPGERGRMAIKHADDAAVARESGHQALDMA